MAVSGFEKYPPSTIICPTENFQIVNSAYCGINKHLCAQLWLHPQRATSASRCQTSNNGTKRKQSRICNWEQQCICWWYVICNIMIIDYNPFSLPSSWLGRQFSGIQLFCLFSCLKKKWNIKHTNITNSLLWPQTHKFPNVCRQSLTYDHNCAQNFVAKWDSC